MKMEQFNSLVKENAPVFSPSSITEQATFLIESQKFEALIELSSNGYKLNKQQTQILFLSLLKINKKEAEERHSFDPTTWAKCVKAIMVYDENFAKTTCEYMAQTLFNQKFIRTINPYKGVLTNSLRRWTMPNSTYELEWVQEFLATLKEEMAYYLPTSVLSDMIKASQDLKSDGYGSGNRIANIRGYCQDIFNLSLEKNQKANLNMIQHKEQNVNDSWQAPIDANTKELSSLPSEFKPLIDELMKTIASISQEKLNETEKLDFNNLRQTQLPEMVQNYLSISEKNRSRVVNEESANSILEDNLKQLNHLFLDIKNQQEERELAIELNNLKINKQYLKMKA